MIDLRVLGTLDLRDRASGAQIGSVLAQPKRTALLCYLALGALRGRHRRERLLALFWPESSEERARNSLNQAVFTLRRSLGEDAIVGGNDEVGVGRDALWCDAIAFEQELEKGDLRAALDLYRGELLPGFHAEGSAEFEQWLDGERERLRRRALAAALAHADELERDRNEVGAVEWLRRAAEWDPFDEAVAIRLVTLLARLGDRAGALHTADRFRARLAAELALEPSAELEALTSSVRNSGDSTPSPPAEAEAFVASTTTGRPETPSSTLMMAAPWTRRRSPLLAVAALGVATLAVALLLRFGLPNGGARAVAESRSATLDPRRVLVAAFENRTGDASLDPVGYMAADWIAQAIARTGMAKVVPFSTVVQETPFLTAEGVAPEVSRQAARRQLAQRIGARVLVTGGYYRNGDDIVVQARIIDVANGELLRALDEVRGSASQPAAAVEELQRRSLGALATLFDERLDTWPDPGDQPSSLAAYQRFSEGMRSFLDAGAFPFGSSSADSLYRAAATGFTEAASLDPAFTTPLLWAVFAHQNARDHEAAHRLVNALETRPLSTWSRAMLNEQSAMLAGDLEAAYRAGRVLAELSPDSEWLFKLARAAYLTGRYREALDALLRIDPERGWMKQFASYWRHRAELRHVLGEHAAALADTRRALAVHPDERWLGTQELWALAALGRVDEITPRLLPPIESGDNFALWRLTTVLEELHGHGHHRAAARLAAQAIPAAAHAASAPLHGTRGLYAMLLYLAGRSAEALTLYDALAAEQPHVADYRVRRAILIARAGDPRPLHETLDWLSTLEGPSLAGAVPPGQAGYWGPPDAWLGLTRARLHAAVGDRDGAVAEIRAALASGLAHGHLHLHDDPDFTPLRGHPAFDVLLRPRDERD